MVDCQRFRSSVTSPTNRPAISRSTQSILSSSSTRRLPIQHSPRSPQFFHCFHLHLLSHQFFSWNAYSSYVELGHLKPPSSTPFQQILESCLAFAYSIGGRDCYPEYPSLFPEHRTCSWCQSERRGVHRLSWLGGIGVSRGFGCSLIQYRTNPLPHNRRPKVF